MEAKIPHSKTFRWGSISLIQKIKLYSHSFVQKASEQTKHRLSMPTLHTHFTERIINYLDSLSRESKPYKMAKNMEINKISINNIYQNKQTILSSLDSCWRSSRPPVLAILISAQARIPQITQAPL